MMSGKNLTIRLEPEEYDRLEAEAKRLATRPDELAVTFIRAALRESAETDAERRRRGLEALDKLAQLTRDLPPIDAVKIVREGREELERRPEVEWLP
jgi:hypothetical protein